MVVQKLPIAWLQSHVPDIIKAALAVLKHLPTHASLEQAQLLKALTTVMHLVVPKAARPSTAADSLPARPPPAGQLPANQSPVVQAPLSTLQTPGQPLPPSLATQPHDRPEIIPASANGQPAQPERAAALSAQVSAASESTQPGSGGMTQTGSGSPADAGGSKDESPNAGGGEAGSPSKQIKMMSGILEVLAREVLNPASTEETRDAAHTCLQVLYSPITSQALCL